MTGKSQPTTDRRRLDTVPPLDEGVLGLRLMRMVEWWMCAMEENTQALGIPTLGRSQAMLLAHVSLGEHRPIRLAEKLGMSRQAVHLLINQLVETGALQVRPDPTDGRATVVDIVPTHADGTDDYLRLMSALERELAERFGSELFGAFRAVAYADWGDYPPISSAALGAAASDYAR